MPRSFPEAFDFVEHHRDHLGVADPDAYVARLRVFMDQTPDDARTAATIAVDAAKSLINIGVVFFAALGAFALTYRSIQGTFSFSIPIVLLSVSALVTIASMITGFAAIGLAYRRDQRPADADGPPPATRPLLTFFRAQALLGLGALVLFAVAVLFWDAGSSATADTTIDHLQSRIDALQVRLDQQAGDLAKASQAAAGQAASAMPQPNIVGLTQVPAKLDAIVSALRELKAAIPPASPPPPPPQVVVTPQPPAPASPPVPASVTPQPIRQEADLSRADWTRIQDALSAQGFTVGKSDGLARRKTREAVRAYQAKLHAPEDGRLTPQQIEDLLAAHSR
jgi:Putative peptidoglycan binding domain